MDVMEPLSVQDLFQGLSSTSLLDSGFHDDDNRDSLLDLLAQSFPDMLTQSYGHLSSLPLDAPDILLSIQDEDFQECDSADDLMLQEFVCEVQNILSDTKGINIANAPDIGEILVGTEIAPSPPKPEDHFSPIKKLCPDQIDLLMGPLLDDDDEDDIKALGKLEVPPICNLAPSKPHTLLTPVGNALNGSPVACRKPELKALNSHKPLVAYVKPVLKAAAIPESALSVVNTNKIGLRKVISAVRVEEESCDEVDIETVDDDELNGRSGAEVLSAKLADVGCQAARVRVVPTRVNPELKPRLEPEVIHVIEQSDLAPKTVLPLPQSFPPLVKLPSSKPKEKEHLPSSVVEKIKQSVVAPRSSILIPHQGPPPQTRGKACKPEPPKVKSKTNPASSISLFDTRTFDHDYCNVKNQSDPPAKSSSKVPPTTVVVPETQTVNTNLVAADECVVLPDFDVPSMSGDLCFDLIQSELVETETSYEMIDVPTSEPCEKLAAPVLKSEKVSLSYCNWDSSRSPSPYSQNRCQKRDSRKRSSCSPSSVSSHSVYRSRSRSSSHGRKSRSQACHFRKQSRGRSRSRHSKRRSCYTYSRSSSQSSFSSRSRSRSLSRSRSRTRSQSRAKRQSWDYKRSYNRAPVTSYNRAPDKRLYDEKTREIEERRVVYVGRLPDGTTKNDLRHRFGCFGPIQEVSLHFRDSGHNYGFVTFSLKRDAYQAVEHGNDDPNQPKFDLSFGGRRQFCKQRYADLDSQYNSYSSVQSSSPANDFDSLLLAAKLKQKQY